jgi:hypothetical protein
VLLHPAVESPSTATVPAALTAPAPGKPARGAGRLAALRREIVAPNPFHRYASRLAVAAMIAVALARISGVQQGYWLALTTMFIMQPTLSQTVKLSGLRIGGTLLGAVLASAVSLLVHDPLLLALAVLPLATGTLATRSVSYVSYILFLTSHFILVAHLGTPIGPSWMLAALRVGNSFAGVLVGVVISLLAWPDREHHRIGEVADLAMAATATYLRAVGDDAPARARARRESLTVLRRQACVAIDRLDATIAATRFESIASDPRTASATVAMQQMKALVGALAPVEYLDDTLDALDRATIAAAARRRAPDRRRRAGARARDAAGKPARRRSRVRPRARNSAGSGRARVDRPCAAFAHLGRAARAVAPRGSGVRQAVERIAAARMNPRIRAAVRGCIVALFIPAVARAQGSVAISGLIDGGIAFVDDIGSHRGDAHAFQAKSGDANVSRLTLSGNEPLGADLNALFLLATGFAVTNGALGQQGRLFGFQSYVGLASGRYGTVTVGRQFDSTLQLVQPFALAGTPFGGVAFAHPFDNDNLANYTRTNNSVKYTSPLLGGFRFGATYGFSNEAGGFGNNRGYAFAATYEHGPFRPARATSHSTAKAICRPPMPMARSRPARRSTRRGSAPSARRPLTRGTGCGCPRSRRARGSMRSRRSTTSPMRRSCCTARTSRSTTRRSTRATR